MERSQAQQLALTASENSLSGPEELPAMAEYFRRHMPSLPLQVSVVAAALGDDAALIGGEALFKQTQPALFS